jgi:hypothetical protein
MDVFTSTITNGKVTRDNVEPHSFQSSFASEDEACLFSQQRRERRHVEVAESSPRKSCPDLLEQIAVTVRIAERGEGGIAGMVGCGAVDSAAHVLPIELSAGSRRMKHLADRGTTGDHPPTHQPHSV